MIITNRQLEQIKYWAFYEHEFINQKYGDYGYTHHLNMVAKYAEEFCTDDLDLNFIKACCYLHDVLEDCHRISYNDLKLKFGIEIAEVCYALTNEKGRTRKDRANNKYYKGIRKLRPALFVKLCDRMANTQFSKNTKSSMYEKYKREMPEFLNKLDAKNQFPKMYNHLKNI